MKKYIQTSRMALLLILITGLSVSCDNSTGNGEEEEHEPIGLKVKQGSTTVVEQNFNSVTGSISLTLQNTTSFTVVFVDEDGDEFTPDVEEHSIGVTSAGILITVSNVNSDSAPFSFDLTATDSGNSSITITMLHEGASEFVSQALPIQATSAP